METVLIQIKNTKAYQLLKVLEDLKVITVLKKSRSQKTKKQVNKIESFRGALKLSDQQYADFQRHVKAIRK